MCLHQENLERILSERIFPELIEEVLSFMFPVRVTWASHFVSRKIYILRNTRGAYHHTIFSSRIVISLLPPSGPFLARKYLCDVHPQLPRRDLDYDINYRSFLAAPSLTLQFPVTFPIFSTGIERFDDIFTGSVVGHTYFRSTLKLLKGEICGTWLPRASHC